VRNIIVENLESHGGKTGILMSAYDRTPITNVKFINCILHDVKTPFFLKNVKDLVLKNVTINGQNYDDLK